MINLPFDFLFGMDVLITLLTISLALCFIRLFLGPSIPNRTIAFDSIAIHAVAILALFGISIGAVSILDAALVVAVLGFLGTTMYARYLERAAPRYYALGQDKISPQEDEAHLRRRIEPLEEGKAPEA